MLVRRRKEVCALLAADEALADSLIASPGVSRVATWRLCAIGGQRQAEWAALGVAADCPHPAGMDHGAAVCGYALECRGQVVNGKIGQRERVTGAASAGVHADLGGARVRLPPHALGFPTRLELGVQHT
jgi:hypothetical protein